MTSYKETFCTNHLTSSQHIADHGREYFSDPHACYGDALGVGGVVVSADGYVVLQKRAGWVAESQNCYDTPGGHCEPGDMLLKLKREGRDDVLIDQQQQQQQQQQHTGLKWYEFSTFVRWPFLDQI